MTTRPDFISSVEVRPSAAHDYVTIWIRHANVGTLCVGKGDGEELRARLLGEPSLLERQADTSEAVGFPHLADAIRTRRDEMGYVNAGERCTLTPWMRGALQVMRGDAERTRCPEDLQPDERTLEAARGQGFDDASIRDEVQRFVDYWRGRGEECFDWQTRLRSWFRSRRLHLDERAHTPLPFVAQCARSGASSAETIPQQMDRAELARSFTRRLRATIEGEGRETDRRMLERAANWMAPVLVSTVGPVELSGHEPPPGNWALFEGPREVIDSLLAQHDHTTAEAGPGVPAPPPPAAKEPEGGSRPAPAREPPAAGTPPTTDDVWRDEETIG